MIRAREILRINTYVVASYDRLKCCPKIIPESELTLEASLLDECRIKHSKPPTKTFHLSLDDPDLSCPTCLSLDHYEDRHSSMSMDKSFTLSCPRSLYARRNYKSYQQFAQKRHYDRTSSI